MQGAAEDCGVSSAMDGEDSLLLTFSADSAQSPNADDAACFLEGVGAPSSLETAVRDRMVTDPDLVQFEMPDWPGYSYNYSLLQGNTMGRLEVFNVGEAE